MTEIWKPVVGYEQLYQVSNTGKVKRVNPFAFGVNKKYKTEDNCLVPKDNGKGYLRVKLTRNNKSKRIVLHRIIAEAFIPNPNGYKTINHKNAIKSDNRIENLEWCTQSYNCKVEYDLGRRKANRRKPIRNKITGKEYESFTEAAKDLNISLSAMRSRLRYDRNRKWEFLKTAS